MLVALSLLLNSLIVGMFLAWGWVLRQLLLRRPILSERPLVSRREVPWRGGTVLLVVLVSQFVAYEIHGAYTLASGRMPGKPPVARAAAAELTETEKMAVTALTDLVLLVLLPVLVRLTSGARLHDFGLSFEGWPRQAAVGIVAALIAAPSVYSVQSLALQIWNNNEHPVQKMLLKELSPGVPQLAIVSGIIMAPMFEELLFRGIFQSWLVRLIGRRAPALPPPLRKPVIELAERLADSSSSDPGSGAWKADAQNGLAAQTPGGPDPALAALPNSGWLAIVLTSLFFAVVHAPQWPAPIALFFLALVIGTVYQWTGSLIAVIFVHATFNGLSTLAMFTVLLAGQSEEPNKTKVGWHAAAATGSQVLIERGWMHQSS
ncbi:MAG: CPBP family intramembrane glutamic endopeptidase [Isosphaerales bacterium]